MIPHKICAFHLPPFLFAIDVLAVQEVVRNQRMTKVPIAPADVKGLINLCGQIVTVIDLRRRLELPESAQPANTHLIVRTQAGLVSLLVDGIGDVVEVTEETFEQTPDSIHGIASQMLVGIHKLKDQLLLMLDVEKACAPLAIAAHT